MQTVTVIQKILMDIYQVYFKFKKHKVINFLFVDKVFEKLFKVFKKRH